MTTPKPMGNPRSPFLTPVGNFVDGRVSHDEMLETARGVSQQDEQKIIEKKRQDVALAQGELERAEGERRSRRGAFTVHAGAFLVINGGLAALVTLLLGGTWFVWPLGAWILGLGAHGAWLGREQDKGVIQARKRLADAKDELDSYLSLSPAQRSIPPRDPSSTDEDEPSLRPRA
ncbi:MAG: 2TM domain-containing protein [Minicystis sp.]